MSDSGTFLASGMLRKCDAKLPRFHFTCKARRLKGVGTWSDVEGYINAYDMIEAVDRIREVYEEVLGLRIKED